VTLPNTPSESGKLIKFWFPVIIYSGIIFYGSSLPNLRPPIDGNNVDKICHIGEYIPFGFLIARGLFHTKTGFSAGRLIGLATFWAFVYGLSDEFHQSFVQGRTSSLEDVLADVIGACLGSWLLVQWLKKRKHQF